MSRMQIWTFKFTFFPWKNNSTANSRSGFTLLILLLSSRLHLNNIKKLQNAESGKDKDPTSVDKFGFHIATCCGYLTQNNEWHDDWVVSVIMVMYEFGLIIGMSLAKY